jgi:hypothetical protein
MVVWQEATMRKWLAVSSLLVFLVGWVGCGVPEEEHHLDQADTNTSVVNYCLWSSGSYWCQDFYTSKWCTHAVSANGWDYTACQWRGWNAQGVFCGTDYPGYAAGWQWGESHWHCQ